MFGDLIRVLGLYLRDNRVIESQLGKAGGENFNLAIEEVGELGVLLLEGN